MSRRRKRRDEPTPNSVGGKLITTNFTRGAGKSSPSLRSHERFINRNDKPNALTGTRKR